MDSSAQQDEVPNDEESILWQQKGAVGDDAARNRLITRYLTLARNIAARIYRTRIDNDVPFADYNQLANLGLIEAVDRFDPREGVAFTTFATYRIRGAILNGLEKTTERRDQLAFLRRRQRHRIESLSADAHEESSFAQMVDITIGLALGFLLEDSGFAVGPDAKLEDEALDRRAIAQLKSSLVAAVDALPDRERVVVRYHYFFSVGFDELAEQLGISKGRVSQLHKRALERIRVAVGSDGRLDKYY